MSLKEHTVLPFLAQRGRHPFLGGLGFWWEYEAVGEVWVAPAGVVLAVGGELFAHDLVVVDGHPHAVESELELAGLGIVAGLYRPAVVLAATLVTGRTAQLGEPVMSQAGAGERQDCRGEQGVSEHRLGLS